MWIFFFFVSVVQLHASLFDWFSHPLSSKAKRAQAALDGFDAIAEQALIDYRVPGVAIGVVVDGTLIYAKGFGWRDLEKKLPVTPDTLFAIGSCTKAFTAFGIGLFVDAGFLHWDQSIIDVIPEFRLFDQYATQNLTFRDLLTHRSGLPRHDLMWYNSKLSRKEVMGRLRYLEPTSDLRTRYQYNNLMYLVAGYALEQLTGKPWEELTREKILKPLDMHRTNFSVAEMQKESDFAFPYIEKGGVFKKMAFRDVSPIGPAGSINSSVSELAHWVQMHLSGGFFAERSLISPATLQEIHSAQVIVPGAPETKESLLCAYGLGWGISSYRGLNLVSHDGGIDGFTSVVGLLPQHGVGVIILANRNLTSLPRFLSLQAIDLVLELPFIDWLKEGLDGIKKSKEVAKTKKVNEDLSKKAGTQPSHPLEEFIGLYEHPGYGVVTIEYADGKLRAVHNGLICKLDHWHYDIFMISEEMQDLLLPREGMKLAFHANLKGEIDELRAPFEPNTSDIIFKKKGETALSTLDYLRQFTGFYEIYGYTVEIALRDHTLHAIIPGQPLYELVPTAENEFTVKSLAGYSVRFLLDDQGMVEEVLLIQPYGAWSAKPKFIGS